MRRRHPLVVLGLAVALTACNATGPTQPPTAPSSPAATTPVGATASRGPGATADPCTTAVSHLTAFVNQLGDELASLRPKVASPAFDSGGTSQIIARVAATMTGFAGLEERTAACQSTATLVAGVASVRNKARAALDSSSGASVNDAAVQREAAATLFALLPDVQSIADGTKAAAADRGLDAQVAQIPEASTKPLGSLPPLTAAGGDTGPNDGNSSGAYGAAYFGSNTSVRTYRVTGSTPAAIITSILKNGPQDKWLQGRAEALTYAIPHDRVTFEQDGSTCRVVATAKPPIYFSFRITLPRWDPPSVVAKATVTWWATELRHVAIHEKHHVDLWRAAGAAMSKAVGSSTCTNLVGRLTKIALDTRRENCEFDMAEYGKAMGLSMSECVNG